MRSLPFMAFVPLVSGGSTPLRVFDRWRRRFLAGVQDPQLRRSAFVMIGLAAGLAPLMAGAAHAALPKAVNDGADTLLMLIGSALVLLMTPGLAFFYGGFTRSKNVLNTMMMSFFLMGLIGVLWVVILSASSFALFQGMFAIITPALISGAIVERVSFKAWFWFCLLWSLLIYSPMAKMVWGGGFLGPFGTIGAIDFAGGTVVHIASGVAALVACAIIGERTTWPNSKRPPHNVPFILLGAGLLWFGWFGFNGASMFAAKTAGYPFLTTTTSASAGLLAWCMIEWFKDGKPTAVGAATGAVAGLVGITPAAGFVYMPQSILIGALTALACFIAVRIKAAIKFDDSLDTFMVHGVGGTVGALLTGILAAKSLVSADYFPLSAKIMEEGGNFGLFIAQFKAVLFSYGFVGLGTALILWFLKLFMPLRVSEQDEERGLDYVAHGEEAYDPMTN